VYCLLALPLSQGYRQVIFIDTDLPENRLRLFKPMKLLQMLEDNDPDVFQLGMLDQYPARPNRLDNMCLREFVALYRITGKAPTNEDRQSRTSDSESDNLTQSKTISLKYGMGKMTH